MAVVRVLSLVWVGTRTTEYAATVAFFKDVLGLGLNSMEPDFAVLDVPDGATVEIFGPESEYNRHFTQPVAVTMLGVLNFIPDDAEAAARVQRLVDAIPSGSYVALSHPTTEINASSPV